MDPECDHEDEEAPPIYWAGIAEGTSREDASNTFFNRYVDCGNGEQLVGMFDMPTIRHAASKDQCPATLFEKLQKSDPRAWQELLATFYIAGFSEAMRRQATTSNAAV
jgi:hypothetical protein